MKIKVILVLASFHFCNFGFSQSTIVTILDNDKNTIPNAHILVKQTGQFLLSDSEGKATINFDNYQLLTLEISFVGYLV